MSRSAALLMLAVLATVLGAACRRTTDVPKADAPSLNVTNWTEKTELYMEYPPLVAGRTALFAVHLTTLADFQPLAAGRGIQGQVERVNLAVRHHAKQERVGDPAAPRTAG